MPTGVAGQGRRTYTFSTVGRMGGLPVGLSSRSFFGGRHTLGTRNTRIGSKRYRSGPQIGTCSNTVRTDVSSCKFPQYTILGPNTALLPSNKVHKHLIGPKSVITILGNLPYWHPIRYRPYHAPAMTHHPSLAIRLICKIPTKHHDIPCNDPPTTIQRPQKSPNLYRGKKIHYFPNQIKTPTIPLLCKLH